MFYTKLLKIILQSVTNIIWSLFSFVVLEYLIILGLYTRGFFVRDFHTAWSTFSVYGELRMSSNSRCFTESEYFCELPAQWFYVLHHHWIRACFCE